MTQSTIDAADEITYCARHPDRDTGLRCNRCERYMCVECAVRTPIGYTCRECVRGHEDKFYAGTLTDYALVAAVGLAGGALTALLTMLVGGFLIVGLLLAPGLGGAIAQLALTITGRRRGRHSGLVCAGCVMAGGLAGSLALTGGLSIFTLLYYIWGWPVQRLMRVFAWRFDCHRGAPPAPHPKPLPQNEGGAFLRKSQFP